MKRHTKRKQFRWHVFHVNCDCASYDHARQRLTRSGTFMRCYHCGKKLGDFDTTYYGPVVAATPGDAITWAKKVYTGNRKLP